MHASHSPAPAHATGGVTAVRRYSGPIADELFLLCRPSVTPADAACQAESVYREIFETLAAEGVGPDALVTETVFFRSIERDFPAVVNARRATLERRPGQSYRPATTFIQQPPLNEGALIEVSAVAVVPRRQAASVVELSRSVACICPACASGTHATVVSFGDQTYVHAANVCGSGPGTVEEAYDMFRVAEGLLTAAGLSFRDVIRTWIYLRDIDRDYDVLNQARRRFFQDCGIKRRPASTGVQGIPLSAAHDVSMSFSAVRSARPLEAALMSTPMLNEAWTYGADFSRGLRLADPNKVVLHVSGTASIDEAGRSVHIGDFAAQADRMLRNIRTLLAAQGASFENLVSAVTYLKCPSDAERVRGIFRDRGFDGFPCALVEAPLCRPELLCETEAVAILPLTAAGA